ncbi:hypothetical protein [Aeromonas sp. R7-2]|uniref:phage head spike fiber domain-containing protein n=1 Tax=Aeromonas sp. R7-2 TaxID=3138474 RepID=UPI0034A41FF0
MAGVWKRDGTVAVTNGNKKVTGTGTTFADTKNGVAKGHLFCITSGTSVDFYEVDYVVSNTELYLVQAYRGVTATGKAYEIITTFSDSVPEFARRLTATLSAYQQQSDAFQALLTSTAATVEVTAPDGTKQTLIPWRRVTSEGEGQAARAKTEADKAAASAALAGDIVAASALPLPDVWAPLSDSLRLITGYGREVKVGEDVVARMVNFSRSTTKLYPTKTGLLKSAAINEPAFGSGGALSDGQSANLITGSLSLPVGQLGSGITPVLTPGQSDPMGGTSAVKVLLSRTTAGGSNRSFIGSGGYPSAVFDRTVVNTISIWLRSPSGAPVSLRMRIAGVSVDISVTSEWKRYSLTRPANHGDPADGTVYFACLQDDALLSAEVVYFNGQLEQLPFASSDIQTAGAAVTRAADAIQIPYAGNGVPLSDMQMTMSAVIKANPRPGEPTALIDAIDITPNVGVFLSVSGQIDIRIFDVQWNPGITPDMTKEQVVALSFNGATGAVAMRVGDKVVTGTVVVPKGISRSAGNIGLLCRSGTNTRTGFGSVRDFKIWHKFFTVDQLKAIK